MDRFLTLRSNFYPNCFFHTQYQVYTQDEYDLDKAKEVLDADHYGLDDIKVDETSTLLDAGVGAYTGIHCCWKYEERSTR